MALVFNSVHKSIKSPPEGTGSRQSETIEQYLCEES